MLPQKQKKPKTRKSAYAVAVKMLAMREHSEQQIRQKLSQRDFEPDEIDEVIQTLLDHQFLSDERFAESYLSQRKRKGYGPVRIQMELKDKGVAGELIARIMEEDETEWFDLMKQAYHRKYGESQAQEYSEKAKRCRYLQNRGFPVSSISKLIQLS